MIDTLRPLAEPKTGQFLFWIQSFLFRDLVLHEPKLFEKLVTGTNVIFSSKKPLDVDTDTVRSAGESASSFLGKILYINQSDGGFHRRQAGASHRG